MSDTEFTISRILRDPLIRQVLRADRTSLSDFALLLRDSASQDAERLGLFAVDHATHAFRSS